MDHSVQKFKKVTKNDIIDSLSKENVNTYMGLPIMCILYFIPSFF